MNARTVEFDKEIYFQFLAVSSWIFGTFLTIEKVAYGKMWLSTLRFHHSLWLSRFPFLLLSLGSQQCSLWFALLLPLQTIFLFHLLLNSYDKMEIPFEANWRCERSLKISSDNFLLIENLVNSLNLGDHVLIRSSTIVIFDSNIGSITLIESGLLKSSCSYLSRIYTTLSI